jgi:hypothetical protein
MKKLLPLLPLLLLVAAPLSAQTTDTTSRNASAGVFTEIQAARGDTAFQKFCLSCHTPSFHSDQQFRMNWFGRSVFDLFKILKTTMPEDNIGGLSDDDYTRVIAYILKLNGFPAGADSLKADSLEQKRIRIGGAESPPLSKTSP